MDVKVSVVVPIYNVEKYLRKCLDSLINQTLDSIEIICVNDGSTDKSQIIVDEYARNHPQKIRSFQKKNGGLADARNFGLCRAKGKYIIFIDSDDWIELNALEEMYNLAVNRLADIVVSDMQYVYDTGERTVVSGGFFTETNVIDNPQIIQINNSACNKLYLSSLFNDVKFPQGLWYEDLGCIPIVLAKASKIVKIDQPFYNYFQRTGSIMHTESPKIFDIYNAIDLVKGYVEKHKIPCVKQVNSLYVEHGARLTTIRIKDYKNNRIQLMKKNIQLLNIRYPRWSKDSMLRTYSFKERIVLFLLSHNCYRLVIRLYDRK